MHTSLRFIHNGFKINILNSINRPIAKTIQSKDLSFFVTWFFLFLVILIWKNCLSIFTESLTLFNFNSFVNLIFESKTSLFSHFHLGFHRRCSNVQICAQRIKVQTVYTHSFEKKKESCEWRLPLKKFDWNNGIEIAFSEKCELFNTIWGIDRMANNI